MNDPVAGRWLTVIMVCLVYLGVEHVTRTTDNELGALLLRSRLFPLLIACAVVLAVLDTFAVVR